MAWPSAGSLSLTNGSANVTGTGTLFLSAYVGDGLQINGVGLFEIAAITDNTHLTLGTNYSGTTGTKANGAWSIVPCSPLRGSVQNLAASVSDLIANWSGAFQMSSPSGPVSVLNGQIKFPTTQNSSSDPNTLDDYEEGIFTPAIAFGGATTGIAYGTQVGKYTKIGNAVTISARMVLTSKGSATGSASVGGLPFAVGNSPAGIDYIFLVLFDAMNTSLAGPVMAEVLGGFSTISLRKMVSGARSNLLNSDFGNSSEIVFSGIYHV